MPRRGKAGLLADLRRRMDAAERRGGPAAPGVRAALSLDGAGMDQALPGGGLARGRLHEVLPAEAAPDGAVAATGAASGFAAALLGRAVADGEGAVLWCLHRRIFHHLGALYGPGLGAFGLDAGRLILVSAGDDGEVLWAMEEGLRSGRLAAVLGEVGKISLVAGRRLALAAEAGGALALLLSIGFAGARKQGKESSAAVTRWRIGPAPSLGGEAGDLPGLGRPRWRAALVRCRGGVERDWLVEWQDETHRFRVVAPVADRPAVRSRYPAPTIADGITGAGRHTG